MVAKVLSISTSDPQYDLLSTVDFPLSGTTAGNPLDGVILTDGLVVVLSDQATASEIGVYNCAVTAGNFTLTLIPGNGLNTGTVFANPYAFYITDGVSNFGLWYYRDTGTVAEFTKSNSAGSGITYTNYNAATDTPPLASLTTGNAYIVTTVGRVTGIQIKGATISSDSFLCSGDIIDKIGANYQLRDAVINTPPGTVKIGTLNNASNIYFINFGQAISYFNQRRLTKDAPIVVTVDNTYDGASYANPDSGTLNFSHPDYNLIEYRGNFTEVNATANTSNSGAIGNQTCNYTTATNTFTVNKYVQLYDETATSLVATNFLGAHSGTFLLTAATSTTISVNNTNLMRVVITALGDAIFSTTKVRQCTNITARLIGTNLPKMQNLIFVDNTNAPILNVSGDWCIDGVVGFGCAGSSTRSTYIANLDAVKLYSGTFPTTGSSPQPIGSVLSISCKTSNTTAQIAAYNFDAAIGQLIMSPSARNLFNNCKIVADKSYGGFTLDANSTMATVTTQAANNSASNSAILVNSGSLKSTDYVVNGCVDGITLNGGTAVISNSQYSSRNLGSGVVLNGGTMTVNIQENLSTNGASANLVNAGDLYVSSQNVLSANIYGNRLIRGTITVGTQTNVINNSTADNSVAGAGFMSIFADNSGASTAVAHYSIVSDAGGIQVLSGSNNQSGVVSYTGYGYFMKTNGSSPTKVINPILATATAAGAIPRYELNASMTATDASGGGLTLTTAHFKRWRAGNIIGINASIIFPATASAANAAITAAGLPSPPIDETPGICIINPVISGIPVYAAINLGNVIFYNSNDNTRITNAQLTGRSVNFTITYNV